MITKAEAAASVRATIAPGKERAKLLNWLDEQTDDQLHQWLIQAEDGHETIVECIKQKADPSAAGLGVGSAAGTGAAAGPGPGSSAGAGTATVGSAAGADGAFQRFVNFLDKPVDTAVLDRVVIHYPSSMLAVGTVEQAKQLYNKAASLPGSSTKLNSRQQHELSINGDFLPNIATKSSLSYAFLNNKPMLLKVPASDQAADHEANVWTRLSQHGTPPHLAGPIKLYELQGSRRTRRGILMPLYPVTMQHMPCMTESNALKLGQQLLVALRHMHSLSLAHCDIKAPNVFIDAAGDAHLGDFGATRSIGADAEEKTLSHVPVDSGEQLDVDKASPALDFFLLAVTLMERLGWLQLGKRQLTMSMVGDSMSKATSASLRDFLLDLLPKDQVPFATCDDEEIVARTLKPLLGRRVTLSAAGDCTVTLREAAASTPTAPSTSTAAANGAAGKSAAAASTAAAAAAAASAAAAPGGAAVAAAVKAGRWRDVVVPLERAISATCGAKSERCSELAALAAASGASFSAPRGAVVPFGVLEAAVAAAGREEEFTALLRRLDDPRVGPALEAACEEMRALVMGLQVPLELVKQVLKTIRDASAPQAPDQSRSQSQSQLLLAVRSSANVEDLAGMSAAGLYESVVGVPADEEAAVARAVAEVWASLYSRRAVLSRRSAGVSQSSARMAVLVMELVAPDLSFVLHTARPRDNNAEVLLAEVAPGQGETLASGTRGSPWRFEVVKSGGAVTTTAFANFSTALMLPSQGKSVAAFASYGSGAATASVAVSERRSAAAAASALVPRDIDYGTQRMSTDADWRRATVRQMATVGEAIEKAMGGVPQDIEGGMVVGPDGSVTVHVFQTRPQ